MLNRAIVLAEKAHRGQFRKSGDPYLFHPLAVGGILLKYGFDEEIQTIGVLHDVLEDTPHTAPEIEHLFNENIALALYALSKNKKGLKKSGINFRLSLYLRRFSALSQSYPFILYVKIADQIHNLSTMEAFTDEKKERKRNEVIEYFMPIYKQTHLIPKAEQDKYKKILEELKKIVRGKNGG